MSSRSWLSTHFDQSGWFTKNHLWIWHKLQFILISSDIFAFLMVHLQDIFVFAFLGNEEMLEEFYSHEILSNKFYFENILHLSLSKFITSRMARLLNRLSAVSHHFHDHWEVLHTPNHLHYFTHAHSTELLIRVSCVLCAFDKYFE